MSAHSVEAWFWFCIVAYRHLNPLAQSRTLYKNKLEEMVNMVS